MLCTKSTVKRTGLNIWYSGEQGHDEPEVDVIAVQGLGADPYHTWVRKQDSANETRSRHGRPFDSLRDRWRNTQTASDAADATDVAETMWLRDLLPSFIPNARIATYSYESDWRRADVKTNVRKCGEQLLNVLHQNRTTKKESRRPLVFVGHSLGGLVIKQALVLAHGDDFTNIRLSTAGIVFLGAPHQGSDTAVYGQWLAQAMGHDKTLLESLKRNSSTLYDIARDFETSYRNADIVCFYENQEVSYGPWRTQLVDQQSATLHGKRMIYLTTDHSGLNKFHGLEDENFCLVRPEIQRMVQTAPLKIEAQYRPHPMTSEQDFRIDFSLQGIPVVSRFVARDAEMTRLRQELLPPPTNEMRRKVFVLHGLGGIGKTQLSVEFARKYQTSYSAVFWLDGSTKEKLKRSIANLASRLPQDQISENSKSYSQESLNSNVDEVVNEVLKWLSQRSNNQWLLIFDNVDREFSASSGDPEAFDVENYFPEADQGSVLVTSRLASLWRLGTDMKLEPVDELQGESILTNSFGKPIEDSSKLVRLLQGLPLAINQAGSYMRETGTNVLEYMKLYDHTWRKLMKPRDDTNSSVLTTWKLSFDHLRAQSEEAANLLLLWAFLDNQDLWYGLLEPALDNGIVDEIPDWLAKCAGDELDFKECMALLLKYSFVDAKIESSSFSMHSVFHHWCFHAFEEDRAVMSRLAVIVVASAVPLDTMPHYSLIQRRLLPHCDRVFSLVQQIQETFIIETDLQWQSVACLNLGNLYSNQDKTTKAEDMYLRALTGYEKARGAKHTSTLGTVNNLGNLYLDQGKLKEAENMYLWALAGFEEASGCNHTLVPITVNNLGLVYRDQGKLKEAEDMYLQALAGFEKALGAEHTSTLETVNNLGNLYIEQGKLKEAEDMCLRALAGFKKAWGAEHTSMLETVNNLGVLYRDQGKLKEAEDMYLQALAGKEKAWGADHTSVFITVNNLGNLYKDQGKLKEAEDMYLQALAGFEKAGSAEHTSTINTAKNLAALYKDQSKLKEAEVMYLRALAGQEKALGAEHTSTLNTVNNLAALYENQDKLKEAEDMYLRALAGQEKALGAEHTSTLHTVIHLGVLYQNQNKLKKAEDMYLRALVEKEKAWGADHTSTLARVNNLGALYEDQGKLKEAEDMYRRALAGWEKALGAEHTSVLNTAFNNLENLYMDQGKLKEAEDMYLQALAGFEKAGSAEHTSTLDTVNKLGALYMDQGKLKEAEDMCLRALAGQEKALGAEHKQPLDTRYNIALLYKQKKQFEDAIEHLELVVQGYTKMLGPDHHETVDASELLKSCRTTQRKKKRSYRSFQINQLSFVESGDC